MSRNGNSNSGNCGSGSGMFGKLLSVVGGVGLGAGLLYLLDPESGNKRRRSILRGVQGFGGGLSDTVGGWLGSAKDYTSGAAGSAYDSVSSGVGSVGSSVGKYLGQARDYASEKSYAARQHAVEAMGGEMPGSHKLGVTVCALSSMAIGAALMYVFDPSSGKNRRRVAQDYARDHLGTAGKAVSGAVSTGYRAVADTVASGYESVSGAVSNVAAKVGIGGGEEKKDDAESKGENSKSRGNNRRGQSGGGESGSDRVGGTTTL